MTMSQTPQSMHQAVPESERVSEQADQVREVATLDDQAREAAAHARNTARNTAREMPEEAPVMLNLGIDVGSTTTKFLAIDPTTGHVHYDQYVRHHARQAECVSAMLEAFQREFPDTPVRMALCGSGGQGLAEAMNIPFVQEVVANSLAIKKDYPRTMTAIELGGQDAKMVFFRRDTQTGELVVSDMRMNGSCAGGTGAFIDEIATLLKVPTSRFNKLAAQGSTTYDISGRCGVYAKTDIQPLLNQGVPKADLALSTYHAIAKQTIGGLAQGLEIKAPVIFEGGPLTFHPLLIQVFAERLGLGEDDIIVPKHPETIVAYGAALSLESLYKDQRDPVSIPDTLKALDEFCKHRGNSASGERYFETDEERIAFKKRHTLPALDKPRIDKDGHLRVYLGIDSGSTTTKFALVDEDGRVVDRFYAPNEGQPLDIAKQALIDLRNKYRKRGVILDIISAGSTGYGELLFSRAFATDCHTVETVAHARATAHYLPDASFILDVGGQDMKAIWLDNGIITDIIINEACSSGCGSFLASFANTLGVGVSHIAEAAFRSTNPAQLGSRCTVFMNSSIVTEQRDGKNPDDIMAGLCRSIVQNIFTKVIRISNTDVLGDKIVVQGGTFQNDAVLRALEQYLGREVMRAPHPGIMGAIGAALLAKETAEEALRETGSFESTFIKLNDLEGFSYTQESNIPCLFCANRCNRTHLTFSNGQSWVTGNRCSKGEVLGDPKDKETLKQLKSTHEREEAVPDMYAVRERLLLKNYNYMLVSDEKDITIGIPRTLMFWDTMPFWTTLFHALGFKVRISGESTQKMFERGLYAVTSDTICFPAKLVHGHVRNLIAAKVDRIFMPSITTIPSENTEKTSESMCAVVKGYPIVLANSDNPERLSDVAFDHPLFHWYSTEDRDRQLSAYLKDTFGLDGATIARAVEQADTALAQFRSALIEHGSQIIEDVKKTGGYAVVLASRPYHNDPLVNHNLPKHFTELGIPVLTADSVPGIDKVDLSKSRLDIVNNFHARMLSSALIAARSPYLEYAQVVSFGCGHDAYLSDEIIRLMHETSGKTPLILKVDESDIQGPLRIRVRSFIETINQRRRSGETLHINELTDPYPVKFTKDDRQEKVILVPNTSHAFSRLMSAVFNRQGVRTVSLDIGRERAIQLGKQYVHNDICFPAQIIIGEALAELETGKYNNTQVAVATGKYIGDCRLTHYSALLRKALDDAGYEDVPIITNDDVDYHDIHPGFKMNIASAVRVAMGLPMIDVLEELLRKIRPYELEPGSADAAFDRALDAVMEGMEKGGARGAEKGFKQAIEIFKQIPYDRSKPRPRVLIVGEYLLNFHPGANHEIERYLEDHGMEVIEARMTDVIRKTYFYKDAQIKEYHIKKPFSERSWYSIANRLFEHAHNVTDRIAKSHPLYEPAVRMPELVQASDHIIHHTFDSGEGVLIPGEILHHAAHGCRSFVILQPFGCLPNHIVGRGIAKKLKEEYPDAQILSLDYDPDVSFANIENRLQMLIMNAHAVTSSEGANDVADGEGTTETTNSAAHATSHEQGDN